MRRLGVPAPLALVAALLGGPALAEVELSFYGGWQGASPGGVTVTADPTVQLGSSWESGGATLGARVTRWSEGGFGLGLDWTRLGVEGAGAEAPDPDTLAFGEGLDILSVTGLHRWEGAAGAITPYVGAGLGLAMGDVTGGGPGAAPDSAEARGPALSLMAGASIDLGERWSVFGEYRGTLARPEVELDGGGTAEAEVTSSGINLGVSFSF